MSAISRWSIKIMTEVLAKLRFAEIVGGIIKADITAQLALMKMTPYYPYIVKGGRINAGDEVVINISLGEIYNLSEARGLAIQGNVITMRAWAIRDFPQNAIVPINVTNTADASCGFSAVPTITFGTARILT